MFGGLLRRNLEAFGRAHALDRLEIVVLFLQILKLLQHPSVNYILHIALVADSRLYSLNLDCVLSVSTAA